MAEPLLDVIALNVMTGLPGAGKTTLLDVRLWNLRLREQVQRFRPDEAAAISQFGANAFADPRRARNSFINALANCGAKHS